MVERVWHLEHSDGREWTHDELNDVFMRNISPRFQHTFYRAALAMDGTVLLMNDVCEQVAVYWDDPDMIVVFDG